MLSRFDRVFQRVQGLGKRLWADLGLACRLCRV